MTPDPSTAELLAIMASTLPAETTAAPASDYETVEFFLRDYELVPGTVNAVPACSLWRMYTQWHEQKFPDRPVVAPFDFSRQMKRHGFVRRQITTRAERATARHHFRMRRSSADRCIEWLQENPDPEGFPLQFKRAFFPRKRSP